jgi:hypothetical protein
MHNARVKNWNGFKFMVVLVEVETWQIITAKHALFIQWKMMEYGQQQLQCKL